MAFIIILFMWRHAGTIFNVTLLREKSIRVSKGGWVCLYGGPALLVELALLTETLRLS